MTSWRAEVSALGPYHQVYFEALPGDVAFSCPAAVLAASAQGRRVLIVCIFSEGRAPDLSQLRRAEERESAQLMGCDVLFADLGDSQRRGPSGRYQDFMGLLWEPEATEAPLLDEIAELMGAVLHQTQAAEAMVPLGIGRHIDRRLTFAAWRRMAGHEHAWEDKRGGAPVSGGIGFWCYEERPYALVDQATKMRLRELGFPVRLDAHRFFADYWTTHYMHAMLTDPRQRVACGARYMESIQAPVTSRYTPSSRLFSSDDPAALWEVASAHKSQVSDLFGDQRQYEWFGRLEARRRQARTQYAERQWNPRLPRNPMTITWG